MSTVTERVAAGAAFLDEHDPEWWREGELGIDLDTLSINSSCSCILGQLYGGFLAGMRTLGLIDEGDIDDDMRLGFMWADDAEFGNSDEAELLTAEWKRVITERRSAS